MDKIVDKIAALGIPGLVLLVAMSATGWAGAAAITAALATLGGPIGMLGGIGVLVAAAVISQGLTTYGFKKIFTASVERLRSQGMSLEEIRRRVEAYPISRDLKIKILHHLDHGPDPQPAG